ncbi:MAG: prepilin-type N-terminal cleavage/methylation domain-containing protein [Candidatus Omnitrophica bacterium]|nr:prepilin-type N-terminal cleavage/methylation domain-containing protein [Candidatus Omnitrophota bacterium]
MYSRGVALIEIIVVIIVISIIATMGLINYSGVKEDSLDKEARANLKLIQAAEKLYHIEFNPYYYPTTGSASNLTLINDNLKLSLPTGSPKWTYVLDSTGTAVATRTGSGGRQWTLTISADEPTCTGCP